MTLLEKLKINIDYFLDKGDELNYQEDRKKLSVEDWQTRLEIFSDNECGFTWFGVDSKGNLAKFYGETALVPELFFQDISNRETLYKFFYELPETTISIIPENLRYELKQSANFNNGENSFWKCGANQGIFIFEEPDNVGFRGNVWKTPYELILIPEKPLNLEGLPENIQKLLNLYIFNNLNFADCQFLDISEYFYCEK